MVGVAEQKQQKKTPFSVVVSAHAAPSRMINCSQPQNINLMSLSDIEGWFERMDYYFIITSVTFDGPKIIIMLKECHSYFSNVDRQEPMKNADTHAKTSVKPN